MPLNRVLIIAHRGASATAPESTRAAIEQAVACRADMVELDAQLTRDHRLVIFHDDALDRTTDGHGRLSRWRYPDLARLDAGAWFDRRYAGQRILLASQALRLVPHPRLLNLELKRTRRASVLIERVMSCLHRAGILRRVLLSSFDPGLLARAHQAHAGLPLALLCHRHLLRALRTASALRCVAFHPQAKLVTAGLVRHAHDAGMRVHVWTVDDPREAQRLVDLGVDGLFTNTPERLRRWLDSRPAPGGHHTNGARSTVSWARGRST